MTARCALYMDALKISGVPDYAQSRPENAGLELKGPIHRDRIRRNRVQGTEDSQDLRLRISPFNCSPAFPVLSAPIHSFPF